MKIGIDISEVDRFADMNNDRTTRLFTQREVEYIRKKNMSPETMAGIYCAKEAFFKALGTGITLSTVSEIEILHDQRGMPYYHLSPSIFAAHRNLSTARIHVSISHTRTTAVAVCIIHPANLSTSIT